MMTAPEMEMTVTTSDVENASRNWLDWQGVFEHGTSFADNPLFKEKTFGKFLQEYSVQRTVRKGTSGALRSCLCGPQFSLKEMLDDENGARLDTEEKALHSSFGTGDPPRSMRSILSKVASFLAPQTFVAWDRYAHEGLNIVKHRRRSYRFDSYEEYLKELNQLLGGDLGTQIRAACCDKYPTPYSALRDRFHRRVLDVYLMRIGGR